MTLEHTPKTGVVATEKPNPANKTEKNALKNLQSEVPHISGSPSKLSTPETNRSEPGDTTAKPAKDVDTNPNNTAEKGNNKQAQPLEQKGDASNNNNNIKDGQPSNIRRDNQEKQLTNVGSANPGDRNTHQGSQVEAPGLTPGADFKSSPDGRNPKLSDSVKDADLTVRKDSQPAGDGPKATLQNTVADAAASDSKAANNQRDKQLPEQSHVGQTEAKDNQLQLSMPAIKEASLKKNQQTQYDNILQTVAGTIDHNPTQASDSGQHNNGKEQGQTERFQLSAQPQRERSVANDQQSQAQSLQQAIDKNIQTHPSTEKLQQQTDATATNTASGKQDLLQSLKAPEHSLGARQDNLLGDKRTNEHFVAPHEDRLQPREDMQSAIRNTSTKPLLGDNGQQINVGSRVDVIDQIRGEIQNKVGGIKDIIQIAAARVFDSNKGKGSEGKSTEGDTKDQAKKLDLLVSRAVKLPDQVKEDCLKLIDRLIEKRSGKTDDKFDDLSKKDKALLNSLDQLKPKDLITVRNIIKFGIKPDLSAIKDQNILKNLAEVFKALIIKAKADRSQTEQTPPVDKLTIRPTDKNAPADKTKNAPADKTKNAPADKTKNAPADKTIVIDSKDAKTIDTSRKPSDKTTTKPIEDKTSTKPLDTKTGTIKVNVATLDPMSFINAMIDRLRGQGLLIPLSEAKTKFADKQDSTSTRVIRKPHDGQAKFNDGIQKNDSDRRLLSDKPSAQHSAEPGAASKISKHADSDTRILSNEKPSDTIKPRQTDSVSGQNQTDTKISKFDSAGKHSSAEKPVSAPTARISQTDVPKNRDENTRPLGLEPKHDSTQRAEQKADETIEFGEPDFYEQAIEKNDEKTAKELVAKATEQEQRARIGTIVTHEETYAVRSGDTVSSIALARFRRPDCALSLYIHNKESIVVATDTNTDNSEKFTIVIEGQKLRIPDNAAIVKYKKDEPYYEKIVFDKVFPNTLAELERQYGNDWREKLASRDDENEDEPQLRLIHNSTNDANAPSQLSRSLQSPIQLPSARFAKYHRDELIKASSVRNKSATTSSTNSTDEPNLESAVAKIRTRDNRRQGTRSRYTVKAGDSLDVIAVTFFGDKSMAALIFDANPHIESLSCCGQLYPVLTEHSVLTIPDVNTKDHDTIKEAQEKYERIDFGRISAVGPALGSIDSTDQAPPSYDAPRSYEAPLSNEAPTSRDEPRSDLAPPSNEAPLSCEPLQSPDPISESTQIKTYDADGHETIADVAQKLFGSNFYAPLIAVKNNLPLETVSTPIDLRKILLPELYEIAAFELNPKAVIKRILNGENIQIPRYSYKGADIKETFGVTAFADNELLANDTKSDASDTHVLSCVEVEPSEFASKTETRSHDAHGASLPIRDVHAERLPHKAEHDVAEHDESEPDEAEQEHTVSIAPPPQDITAVNHYTQKPHQSANANQKQSNENWFRDNGPVSEILSNGVKILEFECVGRDEQGARISLRLRNQSEYQTVCYYEVYSIQSKRRQYKIDGGYRDVIINLPPAQVKEMARTDFRNNWDSYCKKFFDCPNPSGD